MKKCLLIISIFIFFISCNNGVKLKDNLYKHGLSGNVKSVHSFFYKDIKCMENNDEERSINSVYGRNGNILVYEEYGKDEKLTYKYKFIYKDNSVEKVMEDKNGNYVQKNIFTFDGDGYKKSEEIYNCMGELEYVYEYYYVNKWELKEKYKNIRTGEVIENNNYLIDKDGRKLSEEIFLADGKLKERVKYRYDQDNRLVEEFFYNPSQDRKINIKYKYDSNGNMSQKEINDNSEKAEYDYIYEFTFDSHKNWIKRVEYLYGEVYEVIIRKIMYY